MHPDLPLDPIASPLKPHRGPPRTRGPGLISADLHSVPSLRERRMAGMNFGLPAGKQDRAGLLKFDQVLDAVELLVDALRALHDSFPEHCQALLEAGQLEQTALDDGGTNL